MNEHSITAALASGIPLSLVSKIFKKTESECTAMAAQAFERTENHVFAGLKEILNEKSYDAKQNTKQTRREVTADNALVALGEKIGRFINPRTESNNREEWLEN